MASEKRKGTLQAQSPGMVVIDGEEYPVGKIAQSFAGKLVPGGRVDYTLSEVNDQKVVTYIQNEGFHRVGASASGGKSLAQISKEREDYNKKAEETYKIDQIAKEMKTKPKPETTPVKKDELPYVCRECTESVQCPDHNPTKGCIDKSLAPEQPPEKPPHTPPVADPAPEKKKSAKKAEVAQETLIASVPELVGDIAGSVELKVHINMGSFCNFELGVTGVSGEHARQLLMQEADKSLPIVRRLMVEAMKVSQEIRY